MQELFILVSRKSADSPVEACGVVTRDAAHVFGFPHTSVLLVATTWDSARQEPIVFIHKRSPHKRVSPNAWDFCGGHLTFDEGYFREREKGWSSSYDLERAADDTAVREANEELICEPPFTFLPVHIHRFQSLGSFECHTKSLWAENREFSTTYVVAVPEGREVTVWDTTREGESELEVRQFRWPDLLALFQQERDSFADGAARILLRLSSDRSLNAEFEQLLRDVGMTLAKSVEVPL